MGKKVRKQKGESRSQNIEGRKQKKRKWKIGLRIPKFLIPKDEPIVPRTFTPIDYAGGITVFFICWAVYLHTLTPTIGFHDSGDMVTAAYVLGISHPTGYPLYCLLGKLWMTILPIGNIAYRMNLASALCASLACMMVYFIVLKIVGGKREEVVKSPIQNPQSKIQNSLSLIPAMVAALMLAFATTFWEQAVIAEKYTLNALFATLLIFILLKWQETMNEKTNSQFAIRNPQFYLYLFTFTLGLSFTHHMQTIYLVPASIFFIIAVWWKHRDYYKFFTLNSILKMICLFILPLFLYLYLPIRASAHPPYNWGDPETLRRFMGHITGQWYKKHFTFEMNEIYKNLSHFPYFLTDQFSQYFWWISLIGFLVLLFKKKSVFLFLSLIIILNISLASRYSIVNIEDYYIPSYILFSSLFSLCIVFIINKIFQNYKKKLIFSILFFIFPIISFEIHYLYNNRNNYYFAYDFGKSILGPVDEKAVIFSEGDSVHFPVCYLKYCENQREDVALIFTIFLPDEWFGVQKEIWYSKIVKEQYPDIDLTTPIQSDEVDPSNVLCSIKKIKINELISKNRSCSIFILYDEELANNYLLIPKGIFCKIMSKEVKKEIISEELKENERGFLIIRGIKDSNMIFKGASWTFEVIGNYSGSYNIQASIYKNLGMYEKSIDIYKKILELKINDQGIPYFIPYGMLYTGFLDKYKRYIEEVKIHLAEVYWEYGNYYNKKGLISKAIELYEKAEMINAKDITIKNILGYLYVTQNRYQDAIDEFKKAIEIDPNNVQSHMNLSSVYYKKGLFKESMSECRCILALDSSNTYAKQMLAEIKRKGGE